MNLLSIDNEMLFALLSGKLSSAINRKLYRSFRKINIDITPEFAASAAAAYAGMIKDRLVIAHNGTPATFKDKPSMTRLIDNLEKQTLVTRSADKNDRRINIINLTEKGRNLEEMTQPIVATTMKAALNGLNEEEIETARILLNKVFNNVKISLGD